METVAADEANLQVKIDKKKADLERNQKRLATLRAVRQVFNEQGECLAQISLVQNHIITRESSNPSRVSTIE